MTRDRIIKHWQEIRAFKEGEDLYSLPALMLIYTEDGVENYTEWGKLKGGKGDWSGAGKITNEVYIANRLGIPVVNLYNPDAVERVREILK